MTNAEIDSRLMTLSTATHEIASKRYEMIGGINNSARSSEAIELELLNMTLMGVMAMLGEIAKRLPDRENKYVGPSNSDFGAASK